MITLLRKELRALVGVIFIGFILISGDIISRPLSERIDELGWTDVSSGLIDDNSFFATMLLVLALITAYAAYPREHDERTIELLYSLPIRRRTVFATKALAGLLALWLMVLMGALTNGLLVWSNPQSLSGEQWRADIALTALLLRCLFVTVMYCHGLLVSVLRRFGLIPFFMVMLLVLKLAAASPAYEVLNPANLMVYSFDGFALVFPTRVAVLQLPLAALSLLCAGLLWTKSGTRFSTTFADARESMGGKVAIGCGTVAMVVCGMVVLVVAVAPDGSQPPPSDDAQPDAMSFETETRSTEHFEFTYPTSHRERALGLVERSEELYGKLRELAGVESAPNVVVDLTDEGGGHLGIAAWTKVRIALARHPDAEQLDRTFVHELVHVLQHKQSDRRSGDEAEAMGFFSEGSAEFLALSVMGESGDQTTRRAARRIAAASWQRHRIRYEDLIARSALRERHDFRLEYALGEVWAAALSDLYGPKAVMEVFRTLAREDAPRDLDPAALWRDTLQHAGYSAENVRARWEQRLAETVKDEAAFMKALPRLGGGVIKQDKQGAVLRITLDRDAPAGSSVMVAVRAHGKTADSSIRDLRATPSGAAREYDVLIPGWLGGAGRFQYLPGIRPQGSHWGYYETWRSAGR